MFEFADLHGSVADDLAEMENEAGLLGIELDELAALLWRARAMHAEMLGSERETKQHDPIQRASSAGRPRSMRRVYLEGVALMWLDQNGIPHTEAELVRVMEDWREDRGVKVGERAPRTVANYAIEAHSKWLNGSSPTEFLQFLPDGAARSKRKAHLDGVAQMWLHENKERITEADTELMRVMEDWCQEREIKVDAGTLQTVANRAIKAYFNLLNR
jgi:hypothetical protein